jgi:hypothetical protein
LFDSSRLHSANTERSLTTWHTGQIDSARGTIDLGNRASRSRPNARREALRPTTPPGLTVGFDLASVSGHLFLDMKNEDERPPGVLDGRKRKVVDPSGYYRP